MKQFFWDLETEGLPFEVVQPLMPEFEAPKNIKDADKIAVALSEKRADWLDKCALRAITGKIVAFTYAWDDEKPEMIVGNESKIINLAIEKVKSVAIRQPANGYAWNGHGFDLPFLCQRAAVHGVQAFYYLMVYVRGRYYWHESLIDPKLVWSNYSPDHSGSSLKSVAQALGVGEKTGSGKDFAALLKSNPAEAERYALADVTLLRNVVRRMGI